MVMVHMCVDCKFWGMTGAWQNASGFKQCGSGKIVHGYFKTLNELHHSDCAIAEEDEGWAFLSGPNFGCIHHQAKPP